MKSIPFKPDLLAQTLALSKDKTRREQGLRKINQTNPNDWKRTLVDKDGHYFAYVGNDEPFWFKKINGSIQKVPLEPLQKIKPLYKAGEVLYIQENTIRHQDKLFYSDFLPATELQEMKKAGSIVRSKMFLPEADARIFIKIKSVGVEQIQDITDEEAIREGIPKMHNEMQEGFYREVFAHLFDQVAGEGTFKRNVWVFVYEYALLKNFKSIQ
jgi:hypothetical protein